MDYTSTGKDVGYATVSAQPETFMSPFEYAHERINELAQRTAELANRLCGPVPEADSDQNKLAAVPAGGVFETIAERGRDMQRKLDRIGAALNRIERSLP